MTKIIQHAVVPVAGLGTKFLPYTKTVPKEMLPLLNKPIIQYIAEECLEFNLNNILMITRQNKDAISSYFDSYHYLDEINKRGHTDHVEPLKEIALMSEHIFYAKQNFPKGLGDAILKAEGHVGDNPFAILLGDDIIDPTDKLLKVMSEVYSNSGKTVVALMEVSMGEISQYGCARISGRSRFSENDETYEICNIEELIEKPCIEDAPSNLAVIGRYICTPDIFELLHRTKPGHGNEIQLTDSLQAQVKSTGVVGVIFKGGRYDTGDQERYLRASVEFALKHSNFDFEYLREKLRNF